MYLATAFTTGVRYGVSAITFAIKKMSKVLCSCIVCILYHYAEILCDKCINSNLPRSLFFAIRQVLRQTIKARKVSRNDKLTIIHPDDTIMTGTKLWMSGFVLICACLFMRLRLARNVDLLHALHDDK